MTSELLLLQRWYARQCDGDWEHSHGVRLDTLDSPGWMLTVDLVGTELTGSSLPRSRVDRSDVDWVQSEVLSDKYIACGGVFNLQEILRQFIFFAGEE